MMKTTLLTLVGLILVTCVHAQNWEILNPEVTSYYSHSDSLRLTNTINIDSTVSYGSSEISYISNKYKVCDTCDFNPDYEVIIYRYAKEFLGFGVEFNSENNFYLIEGDSLFAQSQIGDSWQFNDNLTASTINIYADSVIGQLDSLKTITLSSNDTIILSRNHGIIRYPDFENQGKYFELKGYHNDEWYYGEVFPNFWSIYDFAVGDEYCGYYDSEYMSFDYWTKQIKILSLLSVSDSEIVYETTARGSHVIGSFSILGSSGWAETSYFNTNNSTETFFRHPEGLEDFFGIKIIDSLQTINEQSPPYFQNFFAFTETSPSENYVVVKNAFVPEFGYRKTVKEFSTLGDSLLYSFISNTIYDILEYGNFLGRTFYFDNWWGNNHEGLDGAVINGDTIGDFCNFPIDLGIEKLEIDALSIHPNPATNQITIEGNYTSLEIYSQTGQLVLKLEKPTSIVDVSDLPSGIYFLKAISEEKLYATKLIIE